MKVWNATCFDERLLDPTEADKSFELWERSKEALYAEIRRRSAGAFGGEDMDTEEIRAKLNPDYEPSNKRIRWSVRCYELKRLNLDTVLACLRGACFADNTLEDLEIEVERARGVSPRILLVKDNLDEFYSDLDGATNFTD